MYAPDLVHSKHLACKGFAIVETIVGSTILQKVIKLWMLSCYIEKIIGTIQDISRIKLKKCGSIFKGVKKQIINQMFVIDSIPAISFAALLWMKDISIYISS